MKLQTQIPLQPETNNSIDYKSKILLLGSCFSENIGDKFKYYKFQSLQNPFGIIFNPVSIEKLIKRSVEETYFKEEDVFSHNDLWHCFQVHSQLSALSKAELLTQVNHQISETHQFLKTTSHVIITLGTAWVYRFLETKSIVANCHKVPQKQFSKELLTISDISKVLTDLVLMLKLANPDVNIIFTVSPVRHLKDGFVENTLSKSHLISSIHQTISTQGNTFYFPSYELVMDELRDYRFYKADMLHPNQTAVNYIWEKFKYVWISETSEPTMILVNDIQKGLQHKPFNSNSEAHKKFLKNLKNKQELVLKKHPFIVF